MVFRKIKIRAYEQGFVFVDGEFREILDPGTYRRFDPFGRIKVDVMSFRSPWIEHAQLDVIVRSGQLNGKADVVQLADFERGLVWIDGRFERILGPGLYALWTTFKEVVIEVIEVPTIRLERPDLGAILGASTAGQMLEVVTVDPGFVGLLYEDGKLGATLPPGRHVFWRDVVPFQVRHVETRESAFDVGGQAALPRPTRRFWS